MLARVSNDAAHADWWLPVKPSENLALAFAMIRWIIENRRFDQRYLENANKAAAINNHTLNVLGGKA